MTRRQQRIIIMNCIYQYLLTGKDIDDILSERLDNVGKKDISFIVENFIGVYNNVDELIKIITPKLNEYQFDRLGYIERSILLMSLYELRNGDADRAVVINEAIEIAKQFCDDDAPKFINGVLDRL